MSEQEVESLHRVLTRLALTQDGKLEDILAKLLPLVLGKLDGATPSIQKAVLDILSHVNTRLQAMPAVHLPLTDLLNLYSTSTSPLVRNFALVYVERAAERAPADARFRHLNALLQGVASRPAPHQGTLLRLTARALEHLAVQGNAFALGAPKTFSAAYPFLNSDADRTVFLNFALRLVLYTPATVRGPTSALAAGRAATAGSAASDAGGDQPMAPARPPPGLSFADVAQIEGKAAPSPAALQTQKLGVLNFTALAGVRPEECLQLYLAAACDPGEQVQRRGDELVKKRCAVDGAHPIVDLEQPSAIIPLFDLFLGSLEDDSVPEDQRQAPAGPSMKGRLLGLFCRSVAAANVAPQAMTVVTECLFGTGTSPRLQQQGMEFSVWMMKHAEPAVLAPAAPALLGGCLSLLSSSATQDAQNLAVRSFAYQALGQLAQRHAAALQGRVDIATLCFHGLAAEPPGVRAAVQEATSCLAGAFMQRDASTESELLDMLHASMNHPQEAVRGAAVQWAVRLFPFDHVQARYLCILGSADSRMQLADAATEGLLPERFAAKVTADKARDVQYPALHSMLQYLCRRHPSLKTHMEESQRLALPPKAYVAAIAFSEGCRRQQERQGRAMSDEDVAAYLVFLENALVREAPADLHSRALVAFLATSAAHGAAFTAAYCHRPSLFERMLGHVDSGARDAAGRLLGTLSSGMTPHQLQALVDGLCGTVRAALDGKKVRFEEVDGGTSALGYIASQLMCSAEGSSGALVERTLGTLRDDLTSTTIDPQLRATAAVALGCAALPLRVSKASGSAAPGVAVPDAPTLATATAALLEDKVKDPKVAKRLVQALGFLAYGSCADSAVTSTTVDALLALRTSKSEEVLLASGEALALVFGGVGISADDILRTPFTSLADWSQQGRGDKGATENETKNKIDKAAGPGESEAMELDGATVPVVPGHGCDPLPLPQCILDAQQRILATVLDECVGHSRPEVRCAGATWLVSLLLFCGTTPAVVSLLPRAQEALGVLLGDESEMTQEMASRGLAACYELADDATRAALVESLVGVLSGAPGRKRRAGDVTGDTQVFEPGTLGNVPGGGGLGTYKEICALATDLGQPDLVYRFMQLANHQAAANASRGAAFGFASVAKLAGDALAPHVGALVPRLYRSLYDPQPKVRDAMKHIWTALVDDPRAELTKHFDAVCAALITDMGSNQWKVREAAALAAADVIQGRRWPELRPHFASLWGAALRVMDDIKETVRQAGMSLVRCMRGLTLRLADPDLTPASESKEAVSASLPLLLELALPSRVAEVQALGVDTTARLVKAAGAEVIRPHLRILIPAMLESLSGLEDSRLNYVEQHAARLGLDATRLESARVSAAQGGPVGDTLDVCARCLDGTTFGELAPTLAGLVRRGVGLNTRAGAGRFVAQVARRLGADSAAGAPPLMRALQEACKAERSPVVRRAYASANAVLAKYAAQSRVDRDVTAWLEGATSEESDSATRLTSGLMLRALAREAGDVFAAHAPAVAPVAYIAQFDSDAGVKEVWTEIWEESTTSAGAGLRIHMRAALDQALKLLKSAQWGTKAAGAAAVARASEAAGDAVAPHAPEVLAALLAELPGRLWDGKEAVLAALGAVVAAAGDGLTAADSEAGGRVVAAMLEAAAKKKSVYRKEALVQLKKVLEVLKDPKFLPSVVPPMSAICDEYLTTAGTKAPEANGTTGNGVPDESKPVPPFAEAMGCLGAAWRVGGISSGTAWISEGVAAAASGISGSASKIGDQTAALDAALCLARRCAELSGEGGDNGSLIDPGSDDGRTLLAAAARVAEEGKSAAIRELALELLSSLLRQSWRGMGEAEQKDWHGVVARIAEKDKLPVVRSQAATLAMELSTLQAS